MAQWERGELWIEVGMELLSWKQAWGPRWLSRINPNGGQGPGLEGYSEAMSPPVGTEATLSDLQECVGRKGLECTLLCNTAWRLARPGGPRRGCSGVKRVRSLTVLTDQVKKLSLGKAGTQPHMALTESRLWKDPEESGEGRETGLGGW